jgi:hypothetical protein
MKIWKVCEDSDEFKVKIVKFTQTERSPLWFKQGVEGVALTAGGHPCILSYALGTR